LTYQKDIGPIIWANCSSCHNSNGAGPFNLISYSDVKKRANTIKEVINSGYMPPWPADTLSNTFIGEKKLNQKQITLISEWIEAGAPENRSSSYSPEFKEWTNLPEPDLILKLPKANIEGNNQDQFFLMKVPYELKEERTAKLVVLVADNKKIVHHCDAQLINYSEQKKTELRSGKQVVNVNDYTDYPSAFQAMNLLYDDGSYPPLTPGVMHYLPGSEWQKYPEEIGGFLMNKKGAFLINQMHYGPSSKNTDDQSELHIYFSEEAPKRIVKELVLGSGGQGNIKPELIIPPGKKSTYRIKFPINKDMAVLTVNPHMHLLGEKISASIIDLSGNTTSLVKVNNWDFRWQNFYTYEKPLIIRKGSNIVVEGIFNNTQENPFNPNSPPIMVDGLKGSMKSTDEMFQFSLNYLDYQEGDENLNLRGD